MTPSRVTLFSGALALALGVLQACRSAPQADRVAHSGLQRLYILNCGEGVAGDISRWSPGVNVGKSMGGPPARRPDCG